MSKNEKDDRSDEDQSATPAVEKPLGDELAEEAITRPEDVVRAPGDRYLPGDPPPGQSMYPPVRPSDSK